MAKRTPKVSMQSRVDRVVGTILPAASSWKRWASLGSLLPTLAEASPEETLRAAEAGVRGQSELAKLFEQERGGITGRAEHTGLLWALERLAWSQEYLPRISDVLSRLTEQDPGGQWSNRPLSSLRHIFLSWMPQTAAPLEQRIELLRTLLRKHPETAWKLIISLLPKAHDMLMPHSIPDWRFWAEGYQRELTVNEVARATHGIVQIAIEAAKERPERWQDIIGEIATLPPAGFEQMLDALSSLATTNLDERHRQSLWDAIRAEAQKHRYFHDADWALPTQAVERLETVRDKLTPKDSVVVTLPLFRHGIETFDDPSLTWEEQEQRRSERRLSALHEVLAQLGFEGVMRLVQNAEDVWAIGSGLAQVDDTRYDSLVIPSLLCSGDKNAAGFATAYATKRIYDQGWGWVEAQPLKQWTAVESAAFLSCAPFDRRTWSLTEALGSDVETAYWRRTPAFAFQLSAEDVEHAVHQLTKIGRTPSALRLLAESKVLSQLKPNVVLSLIEDALGSGVANEQPTALDGYHVQMLLKTLQNSDEVNEAKLAQLEWTLLPLLGPHTLLPRTLQKTLGRDPAFFVEVLKAVFRPHSERDLDPALTSPPPIDEDKRQRAEKGWRLLHDWQKHLPGSQLDGSIDFPSLRSWVLRARDLARAEDRLQVCDITLGEALAHAPAEHDGTWPCIPVRELLEEIDSRDLENGLNIGVMNRRGAFWKALDEGGKQEIELAEMYERHAAASQNRWPRIATVLRDVARDYREQARRADDAASELK